MQEVTKEGSDELAATTKKTIGTNATGRVTVTNRDSVGKQFLKGTSISPVSGGTVAFKLDSDLTLNPAPFGGEVKAGVSVTASSPGDAGNLAAGTTFKVGSESSPLVFAQNDLAFSGGSTQQVTVATSSDRDTLKSRVTGKLTTETQTELESKVGESIIPSDSLTVTVSKESYTPKEVDAPATTVKITVSVKASAPLVKKADLMSILTKKLEAEEKNFKIDEENSTITAIIVSRNTDGTIKLKAKLKAKLLPTLSKDAIAGKIKGKSFGQVDTYLNSLDNVSSYKVDTTPGFFRVFRMLPVLQNNIKIDVENK